jgi:hypothetical protein
MKKLSIAVIFFLTTVAAMATPLGRGPHFPGEQDFNERFPKATEVSCKVTGQFTKVSFTWQGLRLEAYYDMEGNPVATAREIAIENLPVAIQIGLRENYPDFTPTTAIEYTSETEGVTYFVNVESPQISYLLHVSTDGTTSVFKKMKKG